MKSKIRTKFINLFVVLLVLTGNVLQGTAPVFAQTGTVAASATASNTAPAIGTDITVNIHIDMSGVEEPDNYLGSYTATLNWNPAVLSYASHIVPPDIGFTGVVNTGSVGTGLITFNGTNVTGATGDIIVLAVGFNVIGAGDAGLDLAFSAMAAAGTFTDLLPIVSATETPVTVPGEPVGVVEKDGDASSGTGEANATSVSFAHTTGNGENRLILVGVSWNAGTTTPQPTITSVDFTYDTTETLSFSLVRTEKNSTQNRYAAIYRSATEPPLNKTGTLTVTFSGAVTNGIVAGAVNFKGVDQTTPLGTDNGANGSSTAASVTLTGLTGNELVFDTVFQGASDESQILTAGAGQSQHWNAWIVNTRAAASTEQAVGSSVTMSWTASSSSVWAIAAVPIRPALAAPPSCYALTLTNSGLSGSEPTTDLENSPGCPAGEYVEGQVIGLTAHPDWGYEVQAWSGTDDDTSTELTNVVTMPAEPRTVNVTYQSRACYELTLDSGDHGGDPTATPTFSEACTLGNGWYVEGEEIILTAYPDSGYRVDTWSGTNDDSLKTVTNLLTMPGDTHAVGVTYEEIPPGVSLDGGVSTNTADGVNTISVTHTTGAGQNRLTLITVYYMNYGTATTIDSLSFTPGGGAATELGPAIAFAEGGAARSLAVYAYVDPPASTTGTLTANFNASIAYGIVIGAINFQGVNLTLPYDTPATASSSTTTSTPITLDVATSGGDELVFDSVGIYSGTGSPTLTVDPSQDEHWNLVSDRVKVAGASTKQATGTTTTMGWTQSAAVYFAMAAIPINPAIVGPTQQLTMAVTPEDGGTTTPAAGGTYTYEQFEGAIISAFPATGYTFSHWTPDTPGEPIQNPSAAVTTVYMDADYTVTAHFAPDTHDLTVNIVGNGSVTKDPDIEGPYNYGTEVTLTAVPDPGWLFDGWSGDLTGMVNPETIIMDGDKTVTATFIEMQPETVYLDGPVVHGVMESGSTLSMDITTGSGENRLMLVGVSYNCSGSTAPRPSITSVTFTPDGGSALSLDLVIDETSPPDQTEDPGRKAAIYALNPSLNPAASTAGVVEVTFSGSFTSGAVAGVAHFQGVDQTTPLGTPGGAGTPANADDTLSVTLTTSGKELVFDTIWTGGQPSWTMSAVSPQIELWNDGFQNTMGGASIRDAETGTTTMTWNRSNDGYMALVAVPINPAPDLQEVTVTADPGQTKVYGAVDPTFTYISSNPSVIFTGSLSREIGEDVGTYAITIGNLAAEGYTITFVPANFTITPKTASVTPNAASKIYGDTDPSLGGVLTGFLTEDTVTAEYNRVTGETVAGSPYLISAVLSPTQVLWNYDITYNTADFTINHRPITVTADDKTKTIGDADPDLTHTVTSGSLAYTDEFTGILERESGETVGTYSILQGTLALNENYDMTFVPGTFTITEIPTVIVTVDPEQSKVYGELDPTTFTYTASDDSVAFTGSLSRVAGEDVGTYAITQGTLAADGYVIDFRSADFTIATRSIEVTADDVQKTVGQVDPPLTYTITSGSLAFTDAFTGKLARESGEAIGSYRIFKGTLALNANYSLTYIEGTFTINDYPTVFVTADEDQTKVYGESDPILTYQASDPAAVFTGSLSRAAGEDVGTYTITQGDLAATGYYIAFFPADFSITAKPITVTADAKTKAYGDEDPALTYQYAPELISGDSFSGELSRTSGEDVGDYPIEQGTLALSSNYTITYIGANLSIIPRAIKVTADDKFKYPGELDPALTYTITRGSLAFTDSITGVLARESGETVGTYLILQGSLALTANYDLTFINGSFIIAESVTYQIDLLQGWNLVSFNLLPEDPATEAILADVLEDVILVYAWDGKTATWMRFDPAVGFGNTLEEIHRSMGFWINMAENASLTVTGVAPVSSGIPLYSGWNLVGYPSEISEPLPDALSDISGDYDLVMAYHASDTSDPWKLYDPTGPAYANDLESMAPGWGYWIDMNADNTLNIDY